MLWPVEAATTVAGLLLYADPLRNKRTQNVEAEKQTSREVQYHASSGKSTQETVEAPAKKAGKTVSEKPYIGVFAFLETAEL